MILIQVDKVESAMYRRIIFSTVILGWACSYDGQSDKECDSCMWGCDENGCISCFVAGTRILTPSGNKAIEQLKEGESVFSWDTVNNRAVVRKIQSLIRGTATQILQIWAGECCIQGVTDEHPFYCPVEGEWRKAGELREGDTLLLWSNGEKKIQSIHRIESVRVKEAVAIYNLSVEGPEHNYFAEDVLVHNKTPEYDYGSDCETCGGYCYIADEYSLEEISHCGNFYGTVHIRSDLTELDALLNLHTINGDLLITDNPYLTNLNGLLTITTIDGDLSISSNASLTSLDGLSNITETSNNIFIADNDSLTSLDGLNNLTAVWSNLQIDNNDSLTSLDGLNNLTAIWSELQIDNNDSLTSLDGLNSLSFVGDYLSISQNIFLCQSLVDEFVNGLANVSQDICCNDESC